MTELADDVAVGKRYAYHTRRSARPRWVRAAITRAQEPIAPPRKLSREAQRVNPVGWALGPLLAGPMTDALAA